MGPLINNVSIPPGIALLPNILALLWCSVVLQVKAFENKMPQDATFLHMLAPIPPLMQPLKHQLTLCLGHAGSNSLSTGGDASAADT